MQKALKYIRNASLAAIGVLALFIGAGVIAIILDKVTWQQLGDWTLKAVLIAIVGVVISGVLGIITPAKEDK
ncbi:MAG: hypothetical protein ACOX0Z_01460 [Candidatus Nanosyncoccaceae bacterium]|jgi:xanthine/uracil/vitamin C permease (AzgA family)